MTAYDTMISGDTVYDTVSAHKCKISDSASVIKTIADAKEAEVAVSGAGTTDGTSKAKRPSNLIGDVTAALSVPVSAAADTISLINDQKAQCSKLPSMGLYTNDEGATKKPLLFKEVCQGVEYLTAVTDAGTRTTFIAAASFISSAPYNNDGTSYITLANGATASYTCQKRKNTGGIAWRDTKANLATNFPATGVDTNATEGITGGVYKPTTTAGSKYLAFTA